MTDKRKDPHPHEHYDPAAYVAQMDDLERRSGSSARLFDVRRIIGGLFVVYGVIVTIAGITASEADLEKAEGININLWTGLGMLALGVFFLLWLRLSPAVPPPAAPESGGPDPDHPATGPEADGPKT
ncbi:hypothetical protein N566_19905 [Streptomycetaceae bacterium MP113-05]|nr:hypothetical protein N566_19905 [Streptomycetaceae bacterium MP113-05]